MCTMDVHVVTDEREHRVLCYSGVLIHTELFWQLCEVCVVAKIRATAYHPLSNGVVERGNKDLGDVLRVLLLFWR